MSALVAGSYRPFTGGSHRYGASSTFVNVTFTLVVSLAVSFLALTVMALLTLRARGSPGAGRPPSLLRALLVFGVAIVIVGFVGRDIQHRLHKQRIEQSDEVVQGSKSNPQVSQARAQRQGHRPEVIWPLALALGGLIAAAAVAALLVSRGKARKGGLSDEALGDIRAALDQAIDDLRHEPDPRKAVIAAYARMERVLAVYGLARGAAETPYEYLSRIERELQARPSLSALTELFERAKFSLLAVDESMRKDAIDALLAVRDEVRTTA